MAAALVDFVRRFFEMIRLRGVLGGVVAEFSKITTGAVRGSPLSGSFFLMVLDSVSSARTVTVGNIDITRACADGFLGAPHCALGWLPLLVRSVEGEAPGEHGSGRPSARRRTDSCRHAAIGAWHP